ncbi:MAG: ABC transporter permease [Candidatus Bipolaricaulia bacterium]
MKVEAEVVSTPSTEGRRIRPPIPASLTIPAALVAIGMLLPLGYLIVRASGAGDVADLILRSQTVRILGNTVLLAISVTAAAVAIAVPLAWITVRTDLPLRRLWTVLTALPLAIPSYVGGFVIAAALGPRGLLQQLLEILFGVERLPEIYGFPGAFLTLTVFSYPYVLLSVRAGLQRLDPALEEASRNLGRGFWATFRRITLPQLRPAIAAGALLVALYTLSDFGAVSLMQFDSFTRVIYLQYQGSFDRSFAAVLGLMLVALTLILLVVDLRMRSRGVSYHRNGLGSARPPMRIRLGHWRWVALGFCLLVTLVSLALPVTVILFWLVQGAANGEASFSVLAPTLNSVIVSALAAGAVVLAALPVAILSVRHPGWPSTLLERIAYTGYALPGIVVALSLVFFAANYTPWAYQTMTLLIFAYGVLFLPQALGPLRASLLQVSPNVEEAARGLGRTLPRVWLTVTAPLIRPGLFARAALVFLTTMKELPATLLLSPIGFNTLATRAWAAASEGFFARAAAPALLLVLVSSLMLALLLNRERIQGR